MKVVECSFILNLNACLAILWDIITLYSKMPTPRFEIKSSKINLENIIKIKYKEKLKDNCLMI